MDNTNCFGPLTILLNKDLTSDSKWISELKSIDPAYVINKKWDTNKTIIFNYRLQGACVIGLNVFLNNAVIVVPFTLLQCFVDEILQSISSYLTCTIKTMCSVTVANNVGFKLTIYANTGYGSLKSYDDCELLTKYDGFPSCTGVLGEVIDYSARYDLNFKFTNEWLIIPTKKVITTTGFSVRCFGPSTYPGFMNMNPNPFRSMDN